MQISANIVDVVAGEIYPGTVRVDGGVITAITRDDARYDTYLLPGFVDAHVHIESSMLVPSEFARMAVVHGTVATVSDPHEIGNVLGVAGVEYMIDNGARVPFKFAFGAPSCVPATEFETAGDEIGVDGVRALLARPEIRYLSEMMNYPGVIGGDPMVLAKIRAAHDAGKPVDGHAPAVRGEALRAYAAAGITTDHESFTLEEAREKAELGMKVLIREGSAAKNFDALLPMVSQRPELCMFCSDDKHPDDLAEGHIDALVRRAIAAGVEPMVAIRCATLNPVRHYGLDVGLLQPGDPADFIEVDSLERLATLRTVIDGVVVAERGRTLIERVDVPIVNRFAAHPKRTEDFRVAGSGAMRVIEAIDGQLVTRALVLPSGNDADGAAAIESDVDRDVLKIVVVNRYRDAAPAVAFIRGFGLRRGAIASSVAHDSHNIIAVGIDDADICRAVNTVIHNEGGLAIADGDVVEALPLPVAGLMSADDGQTVAARYSQLDRRAHELGSPLRAPFMTLSFMALLVIPSLKLSDRGLFDGERFAFVDLLTGPTEQ
ncbi:MAG TPA: adenine deaminase [Candidatus Kapabacteria bacterium]|nr:adenine deaminase [Candidatus Kapabacteria bacterium]